MIHVFERFNDELGELWENIKWDFKAPAYISNLKAGWLLKCDFRLPHIGALVIPNPLDDKTQVQIDYEAPSIVLHNYTPGVINAKSFTPELKADWEKLPAEFHIELNSMSLVCKKEIVDALECSVTGHLYIYRPVEMLIIKKAT